MRVGKHRRADSGVECRSRVPEQGVRVLGTDEITDLSEMPAERASIATEDMYMMRELELGDKTEIPWVVPLA